MELSITLIIIILTSIISFSALNNGKMMEELIFYPPAVGRGQWYRFFSCGLIHKDYGHLYTGVEYQFVAIFGTKGKLIYLAMYILALGACLIPTYAKNKDNYHYRSLGASGAVSAVVFASILLNPLLGMGLLFIPIYIAGFLFGALYLVISSVLEKRGQGNINHSAHIFGAIFGVGFTIIASMIFSEYPVLQAFIDAIKNMDPKDLIQFGK
jgi:membrane associated rhomboid family serine protease